MDSSKSIQELIKEQMVEPELKKLAEKAKAKMDKSGLYNFQDGVLMRKWKTTKAIESESWAICEQIVMPNVYREHLLPMAHQVPLVGHLRVTKRYVNLTKYFNWPAWSRGGHEEFL